MSTAGDSVFEKIPNIEEPTNTIEGSIGDVKNELCPHCGFPKSIQVDTEKTGCNHVYYPEHCEVCNNREHPGCTCPACKDNTIHFAFASNNGYVALCKKCNKLLYYCSLLKSITIFGPDRVITDVNYEVLGI